METHRASVVLDFTGSKNPSRKKELSLRFLKRWKQSVMRRTRDPGESEELLRFFLHRLCGSRRIKGRLVPGLSAFRASTFRFDATRMPAIAERVPAIGREEKSLRATRFLAAVSESAFPLAPAEIKGRS